MNPLLQIQKCNLEGTDIVLNQKEPPVGRVLSGKPKPTKIAKQNRDLAIGIFKRAKKRSRQSQK